MAIDFSFGPALERLGGPDATFTVVNTARPASDYYLAQILPREFRTTYEANRGSMRIIPTTARLTGTNSPYAPGGAIQVDTFRERTAKITIRVPLHEDTLRELHAALNDAILSSARTGGSADTAVQGRLTQTVINLAAVNQQALDDKEELMRGIVLSTGFLAITDGKVSLNIDYSVPSGNIIATAATTEGYVAGASSTFWADFRAASSALNWNVQLVLATSNTILGIADNPANDIEPISDDNAIFRFRRIKGSTERDSRDPRDRLTLVAYNKQAALVNPADPANPTYTNFIPDGKIILIGGSPDPGLRVGEGPTMDPDLGIRLGYTHIGPTVEGGSMPGQFVSVFQPQNEKYRLESEGVENLIPVLENPRKLAILTTDMS